LSVKLVARGFSEKPLKTAFMSQIGH